MSDLEIGLIITALTIGGGVLVSWMGWVSVTLIKILQGITSNNERLDDLEQLGSDHESRLRLLESVPPAAA